MAITLYFTYVFFIQNYHSTKLKHKTSNGIKNALFELLMNL